MTSTLKPCPFCGRNKIVLWTSAFGHGSYATCGFCNATNSGRTKQQAAEKWNCRTINGEKPTDPPLLHLLLELKSELERAVTVHPNWPTDAVHASAILNEEAGELTQAAIDFHFYVDDRERMREEAIQVGAMALRFLMNLDGYKPEGGAA